MSEAAFDISIGYYRGPLERVLSALDAAGLEGAIVELDGDSDDLYDFVQARTAGIPELVKANRKARDSLWRFGPFSFGGRPLSLPIEGDNLADLRDFLEHHADPEVAIEVRVRNADGYLVEAPDVGNNEIWVSRRLSAESVEALRATLGENLRPV